jgi:phage terminase large subunit-like protein
MEKNVSSSQWTKFKPGYPIGFDPFQGADGFFLDEEAGQKVIDFFHQCICHVKGERALTPFRLEVWQQAILGHLHGWKAKETGLRRFRECFLFLPRKNGKTSLISGLSLYHLFCEDERGAELYACAADRNQARLLFDTAKMMVLKDSEMSKRGDVLRHEIRHPSMDSVFKVISSEASSKHGFNSAFIAMDELHAIKDAELIRVLETSTGSRREPLIVSISTAGFDRESICFEKYEYASKVRDGILEDRAFLPVIYAAPTDAAFDDPEIWRGCNPNLGQSISMEYLKRESERAKETPIYEAVFRRLHMNQWTEADNPFISVDKWNACQGLMPDLSGRECFGGLDLSSTQDLTSFSLCFPPNGEDEPYFLLSWGWIPETTAKSNRKRSYLQWINEGHLEMVPGAVVDYSFIIHKILELKQEYEIRAILFDRWGAAGVVQALEAEEVEVVAHGQGYKDMSGPTKEFLKLIISGKIIHNGNPALRWCVSNLVVETDPAANIKPSKKRSTEKIDMVVSSIMALSGCVSNPVEEPFLSIYEPSHPDYRGVVVF